MHRTVALPLCRDTLFPYTTKGLSKTMIAAISNIVKFISKEPYLEKRMTLDSIVVRTASIREEENGAKFLFKIGVTKESEPLDFLAEQLLLIVEEGRAREKSISTRIDVEYAGESYMKIIYINFEKREIGYFYEKSPRHLLTTRMPDNVWDKKALVEGVDLEWWTVLKATAVQYFCPAESHHKGFMIRHRLLRPVLERAKIYIKEINMPLFSREEVSIKGKGREAIVLLRNKALRIGIEYIDIGKNMDEMYFGLGSLLSGSQDKYLFLEKERKEVNDPAQSHYYHYHFKPGESIGLAYRFGANKAFLYDGVKIEGDRAKILLGRDIFLKVEKVAHALKFVPFVNETKQVDGWYMITFPAWIGRFAFRKKGGKHKV